ncbi:MAG: glycoside hydrolase family 5 protein, partial [Acidimicrobiales bacterium]
GIARDSVTGQNSFEYLYERGVRLARLGFRWERIQPTLGAPLEATELARYEESVEAAGAAGLRVIIDVHNYGVYYFADGRQPLNSARLTGEHFQDLWQRLSYNFEGHPAVAAYDLMNEPFNRDGIVASFGQQAARTWEDLTQAVVGRIRGQGDMTAIAIPVYAGMGEVPSTHPGGPWIQKDKNVLYTVHQYFDHYYGPGTGGGKYRQSYDQENTYYAENSREW